MVKDKHDNSIEDSREIEKCAKSRDDSIEFCASSLDSVCLSFNSWTEWIVRILRIMNLIADCKNQE